MFGKILKTVIFAFAVSLSAALTSFAADSFPFTIEFDAGEVSRLCYAGHSGSSVRYREGLAVTPDAGFFVSKTEERSKEMLDCEISDLSAQISLIYENDSQDGYYTEILKTYEAGSLDEGVGFKLLSDNNIANLSERGKLYSDQLRGLVITFSARSESREKKKNIYLYVCDESDMDYFAGNAAG